MTAHAIATWWDQNWLWVVFAFWFFGGTIEETWRRLRKQHRKSVAAKRQYRIELARAKAGLLYQDKQPRQAEAMVPAAVIPAPPGAAPSRMVAGPCRHERIVPVISRDGDLLRWLCANYPRCEAVFPPGTAIYEES